VSNQDTDRLDLIDMATKKFAHGRFDHDRGLIDAEYLLLAVLAHDANPRLFSDDCPLNDEAYLCATTAFRDDYISVHAGTRWADA
jgi:hypothetical protein